MTPSTVGTFLLAMAGVLGLSWLLGRVCRLIGQPPVIGEIIAGISLGPSMLGHLSPDTLHFLFPAPVISALGVIAHLGVVIYMFLIGLELDLNKFRANATATIAVTIASMLIPFLGGASLGLAMFPSFAGERVEVIVFALFMGVAMAITAFPVLARILAELRLQESPLGVLALTCAAMGDAVAWCLLAIAVGAAQAETQTAFWVIGLTLLFLLTMLILARPIAWRICQCDQQFWGLVLVAIGLPLSALASSAIGIHALFGAFLFGAVIPHDSWVARVLNAKPKRIVTLLFLPAFFALSGLRTEMGLLSGGYEWLWCGAITLVASAGKIVGAMAGARFAGLGWHGATSLGILMNTRGLMELIVLNIGLEMGIITPALYASMVLMAVVTTWATSPLLRCLGLGALTAQGTAIRRAEPQPV